MSAADPKTGPLRMGEVVVEEIATGRMLTGFEAFAAIVRAVPVCWPVRLLFWSGTFRSRITRQFAGTLR